MKKLMLPVAASVAVHDIPEEEIQTRDGLAVDEVLDDVGDVLEIVGEDRICHKLGIEKFPGQQNVKFLLRSQYRRVWNEIWSLNQQFPALDQFVITGTAGIGKSAFRYFVIREWPLKDDGFQFDSIIFNAPEGDDFFRLEKNGKATEYVKDTNRDLKSLALLDPCAKLDNRKVALFGLTIVTSSPSPLAKEEGKPNLKTFSRNAKKIVMN
jgi:hypothetical protein